MGKFFLIGVFLGATVTWGVMTYVLSPGLKGEALQDRIEQEMSVASAKAKEEAGKEWQKKLDSEIGVLNKKADEERAKWEERIRSLSGDNRDLQLKLEGSQEKLTIAQKAVTRLESRTKDLQKIASQTSDASKQLLALRTSMISAQTKLWRTLGESAAVLGQALTGWPDIGLARSSTSKLKGHATEYRKFAEKVRVFIEQQSKQLADELGDLKPYRAGVQEGDIKRLEKLSDTILIAVGKMKMDKITVKADGEGWSDTEVLVKAGDVIHIRAEGLWRMNDNWQPAGPEGWDGGAQYKIAQEARAGGLILRIGVSEKAFPAYLGKPITAELSGRVVLRMNDKDVSDNVGEVKVEVVSCNPKALKTVLTLWQQVKK